MYKLFYDLLYQGAGMPVVTHDHEQCDRLIEAFGDSE